MRALECTEGQVKNLTTSEQLKWFAEITLYDSFHPRIMEPLTLTDQSKVYRPCIQEGKYTMHDFQVIKAMATRGVYNNFSNEKAYTRLLHI